MTDTDYLRNFIILPSLLFMIIASFLSVISFDTALADLVFKWEGNQWAYRNAWVTETLIHEGGRKFTGLIACLLLSLVAISFFLDRLKKYRKGLCYIFITALFSALLVNFLKSITHVDCPWDLIQYGGDKVYHGLLGNHTQNTEYGQCFPAGHASAGYCWFGLYFFTFHYFPRWSIPTLSATLLLGGIFGIAQQLRGAHFISHDLWSAWLCWICAALFYYFLIQKPEFREEKLT